MTCLCEAKNRGPVEKKNEEWGRLHVKHFTLLVQRKFQQNNLESRSKVSELFLQLRSNHVKLTDTKRHFLALCKMYDFQISKSLFTIIDDSHQKRITQSVANRECVTFIGVGGMKLSEWQKYRQFLLQTPVVIMTEGNNTSDYSNKHRQPSSINDLMQEFLMCHSNLSGIGGTKLPEWRKYRQIILQTLEELQNCLSSELIRNSCSCLTVPTCWIYRTTWKNQSEEKLPKLQSRGNLEIYLQHVSVIEWNVYSWKQKIASLPFQWAKVLRRIDAAFKFPAVQRTHSLNLFQKRIQHTFQIALIEPL